MKVTGKIFKAKLNGINDDMRVALVKSVKALETDAIKSQIMPFDTGTMQNESTHVDDSKMKIGKVKLVTDTPYARRLYFHPEYNFQTTNNPNAKGMWLEDYITGSKKNFVINAFKTFMKGRL